MEKCLDARDEAVQRLAMHARVIKAAAVEAVRQIAPAAQIVDRARAARRTGSTTAAHRYGPACSRGKLSHSERPSSGVMRWENGAYSGYRCGSRGRVPTGVLEVLTPRPVDRVSRTRSSSAASRPSSTRWGDPDEEQSVEISDYVRILRARWIVIALTTVVAAAACVTRDVPPGATAKGVPARW